MNQQLHDGIGIILFLGMTLSVGEKGMDAKLMINFAQGSIAEVFTEVIANAEAVGVIKSEINRSLFRLLFVLKLFDPF